MEQIMFSMKTLCVNVINGKEQNKQKICRKNNGEEEFAINSRITVKTQHVYVCINLNYAKDTSVCK